MGAVVSLIVFAIGAIFRFATNVHSSTWNIRTIGDILMIVGVVGLVMAVVSFMYWDGLGVGGMSRRRRTIVRKEGEPVYGRDGYARTTYGQGAGYGSGLAGQDGYQGRYAPAADGTVDPTRRFGTVVEEEERSVY
ncbi:MAG TPA: hypothetical protein VFH58_05670 [Acidimicrobiales bacterium]|nr:hypothetical protein [Acidimicrobiales bacterium]